MPIMKKGISSSTDEGSELSNDERGYTGRPPKLDQIGEEMSQQAQIWDIYLERARSYDKKMVQNWDNGIDVLLVFAGLFSSVLTTILVQASNSLSPDPSVTTNVLLQQVVLLLQNSTVKDTSLGSAGGAVGLSSSSLSSMSIRWVNGLWFTSLVLALSAAFVCIMAKQWTQAYLPQTTGTSQEQAHNRQALFDALQHWHVGDIIEILPFVLHISLLLFFAGLVVFVWSLDVVMGVVIFTIVGILSSLYSSALFLPVLIPGCPYHNPALRHIAPFLRSVSSATSRWSAPLPHSILRPYRRRGEEAAREEDLGRAETRDIESVKQDIVSLTWLTEAHTDLTVHEALVHAIAGAPLKHAQMYKALVNKSIGGLLYEKSLDLLSPALSSSVRRANLDSAEVYLRASVKLSWPSEPSERAQNYVGPGLSEEMINELVRQSEFHLHVPVHIYLTAFSHFLIERVRSNSGPLSLWQKSRIIMFLPVCGLDRNDEGAGAGPGSSDSGMDAHISLMCLFVDCLARYLSNYPLLPDDAVETYEYGWTTGILQFLLNIMVYTNANPISKELRVATAHALYCAILFDSVNPSILETYLAPHRFELGTSAGDFMGPVCFRFLNAHKRTRNLIPWLRENCLQSVVVAGLCRYRTLRKPGILHHNLASVVSHLTLVLTDEKRGIPIHTLERKDCKSLLLFWQRIHTGSFSPNQLDGMSRETAIQAFLKDLRPFVEIVNHAYPSAWIEANAIFRVLFAANRANWVEVLARFHEANGFHIIVRTIRHAYKRNTSADSGSKLDRDVSRHLPYVLDGLRLYTKLLLLHGELPVLLNDSTRVGKSEVPTSGAESFRTPPDSKQAFRPDSSKATIEKLPISPPRLTNRALDTTTANVCIEEIFRADSDIFAFFIEHPQLSVPLDSDEFLAKTPGPSRASIIAKSAGDLLFNLQAMRPNDSRWGEVFARLSEAKNPDPMNAFEPQMTRLRREFAADEGNNVVT